MAIEAKQKKKSNVFYFYVHRKDARKDFYSSETFQRYKKGMPEGIYKGASARNCFP